jgi:hypothetical protein
VKALIMLRHGVFEVGVGRERFLDPNRRCGK